MNTWYCTNKSCTIQYNGLYFCLAFIKKWKCYLPTSKINKYLLLYRECYFLSINAWLLHLNHCTNLGEPHYELSDRPFDFFFGGGGGNGWFFTQKQTSTLNKMYSSKYHFFSKNHRYLSEMLHADSFFFTSAFSIKKHNKMISTLTTKNHKWKTIALSIFNWLLVQVEGELDTVSWHCQS